jgi:hypothetical protein
VRACMDDVVGTGRSIESTLREYTCMGFNSTLSTGRPRRAHARRPLPTPSPCPSHLVVSIERPIDRNRSPHFPCHAPHAPARTGGRPPLPPTSAVRPRVCDRWRCAMRSRMQAAVKAAEANLFRSPTRIKFKNILFIRFFLRNIRDINFIVDLAQSFCEK